MIYEVLKYFTSFSRINRFAITLQLLSNLFELWKFKSFQFVSYTASVCLKNEFSLQAIRAMKHSKWFFLQTKSVSQILKLSTSYASFENFKELKFILHQSAKKFFSACSSSFHVWNISSFLLDWIFFKNFEIFSKLVRSFQVIS